MRTLYRYNAKERTDRRYNRTGKEKNPNRIKFFANDLKEAESYKNVYDNDGFFMYTCELETLEIPADTKLFDMEANFAELQAYKNYKDYYLGTMLRDYKWHLGRAKTKKDVEFWNKTILDTEINGERDLIKILLSCEFQSISDYENQNILVFELKSRGYKGYFTKKETAIF